MSGPVIGGPATRAYLAQRWLETQRRTGQQMPRADFDRDPVAVACLLSMGIPVHVLDEDGRRCMTLRPKAAREAERGRGAPQSSTEPSTTIAASRRAHA